MPRYLADTISEERWGLLMQLRADRRADRADRRADRIRRASSNLRWGPDLTYWEALEYGFVAKNEQRAMLLLAQICDEERVSLYCATGLLPALGNVTKKTYLVTRGYGADELDDGVVMRNWCAYTPDKNIPKTDGVIAIKTLIEGEEMMFRKNSNKHHKGRTGWMKQSCLRAAVNPHNQAICPEEYRKAVMQPT